MKASLLLILFLLSSCINMSVLTQKKNEFLLEIKNAEIKDLTASEWAVGPKGKQRVHRGVRVKVTLPQFEKEDAVLLMKKRDVDSLLIKISREVKGALITVGYLSIPINKEGKSIKQAFFFLDYYAAGVRSSHTRYMCPPYNHDFKVFDLDIKELPKKMKYMVSSTQYERSVKDGHHSRFLYNGQRFVAGKTVLGRYFLNIALYDSYKNRLKSEYYPYSQYFSVGGHERTPIKGCPFSTGDGILQDGSNFKFKR